MMLVLILLMQWRLKEVTWLRINVAGKLHPPNSAVSMCHHSRSAGTRRSSFLMRKPRFGKNFRIELLGSNAELEDWPWVKPREGQIGRATVLGKAPVCHQSWKSPCFGSARSSRSVWRQFQAAVQPPQAAAQRQSPPKGICICITHFSACGGRGVSF